MKMFFSREMLMRVHINVLRISTNSSHRGLPFHNSLLYKYSEILHGARIRFDLYGVHWNNPKKRTACPPYKSNRYLARPSRRSDPSSSSFCPRQTVNVLGGTAGNWYNTPGCVHRIVRDTELATVYDLLGCFKSGSARWKL